MGANQILVLIQKLYQECKLGEYELHKTSIVVIAIACEQFNRQNVDRNIPLLGFKMKWHRQDTDDYVNMLFDDECDVPWPLTALSG